MLFVRHAPKSVYVRHMLDIAYQYIIYEQYCQLASLLFASFVHFSPFDTGDGRLGSRLRLRIAKKSNSLLV